MQPLSLPREPAAHSFVAQGAGASFVASLSVDRRLAAADVAGDLAHVAMLQAAGLLTRQEAKQVAAALRDCLSEIEAGTFPWDEALEDVHTNVEARVIALAGRAGEKLHAARSRNDQVVLDERLHLRLAIEGLLEAILPLQRALLRQAEAAGPAIVPGYTHLQRAQPILLAHALLAHLWRLSRDADRLYDAFLRVNISPAGAGAVAGTSLPVDPQIPAALLGFDRAFANSVDATSDRDFLVETTGALALTAVHLSQLAEDLVLASTEEFGLASLADGGVAGSSFLPNKRNPDVPELVRGTAGGVIGDLLALLALLKGLPLGYSRDLQAGKASAFHAIDATSGALAAMADVVAGLRFQDRAAAIAPAESAALLVEYLVRKGVPHREAYETVKSHLPAIAASRDEPSALASLRAASRDFDEGAVALLRPSVAVAAVASPGGTGPEAVAHQLLEAEATLGRQSYHINLIAKKNRRISDLLSGEAGP